MAAKKKAPVKRKGPAKKKAAVKRNPSKKTEYGYIVSIDLPTHGKVYLTGWSRGKSLKTSIPAFDDNMYHAKVFPDADTAKMMGTATGNFLSKNTSYRSIGISTVKVRKK